MTADENKPEPWLRGTRTDVDAVRRQVLHALDLAEEDVARWCDNLLDEQMHIRPFGLASVAYHLLHIVRSLDRMLTHAEGRQLAAVQLDLLAGEMKVGATRVELFREFSEALEISRQRVLAFSPATYEEPRGVGRKMLPSTVGGLLVHCAEHTQRHVGQAVTTAKIVAAIR